MTNQELIMEAKKARMKSYAPYSHYCVGAALLTQKGMIYHGCNIENAAYSPTNCAERTAFFKAIYEGERDFDRIAIVGGPEGEEPLHTCAPCGVCRQVMLEFCEPDSFVIVMLNESGEPFELLLNDLAPYGFGPHNLK